MQTGEKCFFCGGNVVVGVWRCRSHVRKLNVNTEHYACCGAAHAQSACKTHRDAANALPQGCHRIDCTATLEERMVLLDVRPYCVAPLSDLPPQFKPEVSFFFRSKESLQKNLRLPLPSQRSIVIDPEKEHDTLREKLQAMLPAIGDFGDGGEDDDDAANDPFSVEWRAMSGDGNTATIPDFIPFVIILRVDPFQKPNVKAHEPCKWES